MTPEAWAYTAGARGLETRNGRQSRCVCSACRSRRACLTGAARRNLGCEIFGVRAAAPLLTCPIGVLEMMHPDADLAVARAMAAAQSADDHFVSGVVSDGGDRQGQRRWPALLPALLGQIRRHRRELREARRGVRLQSHLHHARHRHARLAPARSRSSASCRSCAGRASRNILPTPRSARCCRKRRRKIRRRRRFSSRRSSPILASIGRASRRSDRGRNFPSCSKASCAPTTPRKR